jgi:hypothetical protein
VISGFFEQFDLCTRQSDTISLPLTARDSYGNEASCYVEIEVVDTSPDTDGDGTCLPGKLYTISPVLVYLCKFFCGRALANGGL